MGKQRLLLLFFLFSITYRESRELQVPSLPPTYVTFVALGVHIRRYIIGLIDYIVVGQTRTPRKPLCPKKKRYYRSVDQYYDKISTQVLISKYIPTCIRQYLLSQEGSKASCDFPLVKGEETKNDGDDDSSSNGINKLCERRTQKPQLFLLMIFFSPLLPSSLCLLSLQKKMW